MMGVLNISGSITIWRWAKQWRGREPKAVACIESDLETLLAHFQEPPALRVTLRTINPIERVFREVRRRTRPMTVMNQQRVPGTRRLQRVPPH